MNGDKSAKPAALRGQRQARAHQQQLSVQKKTKDPSLKSAQSGTHPKGTQRDTVAEMRAGAQQEKRQGKVSSSASASASASPEARRRPGAQRKLSDASNTSEDLSKDSGCLSGKLSTSDSSSEMSDCPSECNKRDSPSSDNELSWIDAGAYVSPANKGEGDSTLCAKAAKEKGAQQLAAVGLGLFRSSGSLMDLMMGETTDDLVRELEDLRSENEYLKDEVEELRCEMLEMRDMFQEEEVYQLQELRLQLEQANKTCRILQYRLRKAERRSIRVAQTGQVDGELVRSLEHDIKVAKSVSLRLYNELEVAQKTKSQLEWENEALREKTQELEVAKQVLQAEVEKTRESTLKRKGSRSASSKAEKRLSQQIEDDSADLRCQLHFAKEELALMCKKLTKLVLESEAAREELTKYRSTYGDLDPNQSPEGRQSYTHAREAEFKVHLKLVEEEATLLSRRIVELEVENRGLRAEMGDLREKVGRWSGDAEEEGANRQASDEIVAPQTSWHDSEEEGPMRGRTVNMQVHNRLQSKGDAETSSLCDQTEAASNACHMTREGPVGGERTSSASPEAGDGSRNPVYGLKTLAVKDYESLLALRDHSCILSSAMQLLMAPPKNGHCSSPSESELNGKAQKLFSPGPLNEALELLQAMLLAFIERLETFLGGEDEDHKGGLVKHHHSSFSPARDNSAHDLDAAKGQDCAEDLRTSEVKERQNPGLRTTSAQLEHIHNSRGTKMQLLLQILKMLHQWCQVKGPENRQGKENTVSALQRLLQDLGTELQGEEVEFGSVPKALQAKAAERAIGSTCDQLHPRTSRTAASTGRRHQQQPFSPDDRPRKNWCYVSHEVAQLDREDPVKTWDHLIMPLSFPDLDFERMSLARSHTAPERSAVRIYYSPPSARRVQLAELKQSPVARDAESVDATPPWFTPPTSFSTLFLGSSANLSDDVKELTSGWRPSPGSRLRERWVDVACSGTQTPLTGPLMVSVGLQTDCGSMASRGGGPSRPLSASLVSSRSHHISTSLDAVPSRVDRCRGSASSPKLYRRHSASGASSPPSSSSSASLSSSSSGSASRDRPAWNVSSQSPSSGIPCMRHSSPRSSAGQSSSSSSSSSSKPPSKSAGANRYGMVTEFLRRVSGRAEKTPPGSGLKTKSSVSSQVRNLERVPARSPAAAASSLHRNDSVTRIVNQRFMKQRDESARPAHKEEKESGQSGGGGGVRHSSSASTTEDGNYGCSSTSSLTFCFARSSRCTQRLASQQGKLLRHRYSPPARPAADPQSCG